MIVFFLVFLIINHFLFKITEYVENAFPSIAPNSKLVVNLLTYQIRPKERWDVAFIENKDNSKEFLTRRILGLPNESIYLKNGDVYIDGMLKQKNSELQKGLWVPCFDIIDSINKKSLKPEDIFTAFDSDFWSLSKDGSLKSLGEGRGNVYLTAEQIGDKTCNDFCISFDLMFNKDKGQIFLMVIYYDKQLVLNLPSASIQKNAHIQEEMKILQSFQGVQMKPGVNYHVEMWAYDRKTEIYINGTQVFRKNWGKDIINEKRLKPTSVLFGTIDSDATISNLNIKKDILFTQSGRYGCDPEMPYKLSANQYFVATENQETASSDSRSFGAISSDLIKGKVIMSLYPDIFKWIY